MIVQELQSFTSFLVLRVLKDKTWMDLFNKLSAELEPVTSLISKSQHFMFFLYEFYLICTA